jgi:hypothetical protein
MHCTYLFELTLLRAVMKVRFLILLQKHLNHLEEQDVKRTVLLTHSPPTLMQMKTVYSVSLI